VERFNLRKLNELEFRKQYQIEISNWSAALENLNNNEDMNMAWENIKENIRTSANKSLRQYEMKQHKPWFDEESSPNLDHRIQSKMRWLQDPNQNTVDNLSNAKLEASRYFKNES
jgi:hypothetical protein